MLRSFWEQLISDAEKLVYTCLEGHAIENLSHSGVHWGHHTVSIYLLRPELLKCLPESLRRELVTHKEVARQANHPCLQVLLILWNHLQQASLSKKLFWPIKCLIWPDLSHQLIIWWPTVIILWTLVLVACWSISPQSITSYTVQKIPSRKVTQVAVTCCPTLQNLGSWGQTLELPWPTVKRRPWLLLVYEQAEHGHTWHTRVYSDPVKHNIWGDTLHG